VVSETLAEVMRDQSADLTERALVKAQAAGVEPTKAVIADFIREDLQTIINVSHLGGSVAALLMGLDPTVAGYTAANALYNNFALSTVRKAIEEYGEALAAGAHESYESVKSALEGATSEALERIADILENHPERVAMCAEIMILSIVAAREERLGRPASHAAGIGKGPTGQKIEAQKKEGITATLKAAPKFFKDLARSIRSGKSGGGAEAGGGASAATAPGASRPAEAARQPQKQVRFADESKEKQKLLWGSWKDYEKRVIDGREYATIGDRLYTKHAVDRMQPSGLGSPAGQIGQGRSIAPRFVEDTIKNGIRKIEVRDGIERSIIRLGNIEVITEQMDKVIITVKHVS
jgi:hypothetical protein